MRSVNVNGPPLQVAIVVQARMGASRLPGKVLKEVLGKPLLFYLLERLKRCRKADAIVVATTDQPKDEVVDRYAWAMGVHSVRGDENNVLSRFGLAADRVNADVIVRITADCPLMDPVVIDQMIEEFLLNADSLDYLSNTLQRTYPRGLDIEIFSKKALEKALNEAKTPSEQEHVTPYFYQHPEVFRLKNFSYKRDESKHRWTVDTKEDLQLITWIIEALYLNNKMFSLEDMLNLISKHPDWEEINRDVVQKSI
jgi:spore coat polysaccharide biosynthesis protein SpsF